MSKENNTISFEVAKGRIVTISDCDADLMQGRWYLLKSGRKFYARGRPQGSNRQTLMHRIILERKLGRHIKQDMVCDHIDHNGLNNTWENLREVTHLQNCRHRNPRLTRLKLLKPNPSDYVGVVWDDDERAWIGQLLHRGVYHYLGAYKSQERAADTVNEQCEKLGIPPKN